MKRLVLLYTMIAGIVVMASLKCEAFKGKKLPFSETIFLDSVVDNWKYSQSIDKMEDDTTYLAYTKSADVLDFKSPYEGGVNAYLNVSYMHKRSFVYFRISKGQIIGATARIKFDNEKPVTVKIEKPSGGTSTAVFLIMDNIANKVKKASKVIVEVEFYEDGLRQVEFDTNGLVWNH